MVWLEVSRRVSTHEVPVANVMVVPLIIMPDALGRRTMT